ncbi:restriction endonuclease [Mycobacterium hackensackense]|uniref:restriction endonuclease n=1 Tax=Mycobacterium hackensackense TaxID=228909 RepID=UPI0022659A52|nr:restriction endonuclease [Mycobacterium hackensackense]MCV7254644.1 restriction endonuclease [Mycobacterium hackensackense]
MDLSAALAAYDAVALNLDKLDRVWTRMEELVPVGPFLEAGSDNDIAYTQLGEHWTEIANSLPAIHGWKLVVQIIDYAAIGQARLDYLDNDDPDGLRAFEVTVAAPRTEAHRYRHKLAAARRRLVRTRCEELVRTVDTLLVSVPVDLDQELPEAQAAPILMAIEQAVHELERLLGESLKGGPRQVDLHRHLHFAQPHDLHDIAVLDWPVFRPHLEQVLYDDDDPVFVDVEDLAQLTNVGSSRVSATIHWDRIDADGFERLLARFLEQSGTYVRIRRLMNVNAADAGRDIEAYRRIVDGLVSERHERVIVQAKHRPAQGVSATEISDLVHGKLPLWEGEPIRCLIVATTGTFTQEAVRWVDDHNRAARRPDIELWSSNEIDALLRKWPAVVAEFGLID